MAGPACSRARAPTRAMGVSSLHTWVEAKKLGKQLSIRRSDAPGEPPKSYVVVDVCALMLYLYGPNSLVADFDSMRANVERMVSVWAAQGVALVAVIDGAVPAEKTATWLARRRKDARTVVKINQAMRGQKPPVPGSGRRRPPWLPPAFSQSYLGQAFRAAGCRVVFTTIEADRVAAGIASELPGALGVLGHDSDYLVFGLPRGTRYLDMNTLRVSKSGITVMSYEQEDVLQCMGVPREALPLLAADLGFDLVARSSRLTSLLIAERERRAVQVAVVDESGGVEAVAVSVDGDSAEPAGTAMMAVELSLKKLRERVNMPSGLEPRAERERAAIEWYMPAPPLEEATLLVTRPHVEMLLQHRTFVGPLCVEDVTPRNENEPAGPSVFEATAKLRASVYKRLFGASQPDADVVTEFLCSARCEQPWDTTTCSFADAAPAMHPRDVVAAAPGVAPTAALARHVVDTWLAPFLTSAQARALIRQADPQKREAARLELRTIRGDAGQITLRSCWPQNVQAATLFLIAMDIFCFGCRGEEFDPPVWQLLVRCVAPHDAVLCPYAFSLHDLRTARSSTICATPRRSAPRRWRRRRRAPTCPAAKESASPRCSRRQRACAQRRRGAWRGPAVRRRGVLRFALPAGLRRGPRASRSSDRMRFSQQLEALSPPVLDDAASAVGAVA